MTTLLFPGRHLLHTTFQAAYLRAVLQMPPERLDFWGVQRPPAAAPPVDQVTFAITSSNQAHSRYNPIPFHVRAIGVDRFAQALELSLGIRYRILGIPHYPPTSRFAEITLKEILEQTEGELHLTPENCLVLCSTPAVMDQYSQIGFPILPAQYGREPPHPPRPIDLVQRLVAAGEGWTTDPSLRADLDPATFDLWRDFPHVPRRIIRLWRDPLLNDDGSLTAERDYASYAYGMGNREIMALKYGDIRGGIRPGKIVDEGCADGALLAFIARDFPDSDLIGIEITGEFMARALERQRGGEFGEAFVHFHQRNITRPIFEANSIDTTICNSTLHELWSYGGGAETVRTYFKAKFDQTAPGGRLIIRDVCGPTGKDQTVLLWLTPDDGEADVGKPSRPESREALRFELSRLSTAERFHRFARDFHGTFAFEEVTLDGRRFFRLTLEAAAEFLSKKDYLDNWQSEMRESFAFWEFDDWKRELTAAGFTILENPNQPEISSRVYTNPWIVANRWEGRAALYRQEPDGNLIPLPWPETNILLVAEK